MGRICGIGRRASSIRPPELIGIASNCPKPCPAQGEAVGEGGRPVTPAGSQVAEHRHLVKITISHDSITRSRPRRTVSHKLDRYTYDWDPWPPDRVTSRRERIPPGHHRGSPGSNDPHHDHEGEGSAQLSRQQHHRGRAEDPTDNTSIVV